MYEHMERLNQLYKTFELCGLKKEQWLEMQLLAHNLGYCESTLCKTGELVKNGE